MEFKRISKKAIGMWITTRFIFMLIFIVPPCAAAIIFELTWLWLPVSMLVVYALTALVIYPILEYYQWAYLITDDRIEIKKGFFFRTHDIIPIGRIQHVNLRQGPIARMFGVSRVEIHTAGSMFHIEGVSSETANEIGDKLRALVSERLASEKA